ncbi:MAG TPA: hypothetical protein VK541_13070 [Pedobacter sp.]|uniref:hypothetical protein n=1 Tax=Pedobacter sp. TaxID=1411316 RepID=UPI002B72474E|nr:hypothetical protein [Pedobacter sp.]HMI03413.1 hypothetical protein [Pedobacter sp.]
MICFTRKYVLFTVVSWCVTIGIGYGQTVNDTKKEPVQFTAGKSAYVVSQPVTPLEKRITDRLLTYLTNVLKHPAKRVAVIAAVPSGNPAIVLSSKSASAITSSSPEAYQLQTRMMGNHPAIVATGKTELGLKRAVQHLILESMQIRPGLVIPVVNVSEYPWIAKREWTICPWAPDRVRRSFSNPNADKRLNIWLYGDQQIKDYVEMFDWFGFSGCQLMETPANYAAMGSAEAFRDRQIKFAKAIRENGQNVTYWVWAAQFDDYGWFDKDVVYAPSKGNTAFTDPEVRATFEKYYNGYAKMAPYADLLIAHFYDPGSLTNRDDVFSYLKLLQEKFRAKNPDVRLGVDFWAAGSPSAYMQQLTDHGFGDALLLEMSLPNIYTEGKRETLHKDAKLKGLKMGMWGWYMTEYETDQMPMMHVNAKALKGFYQEIKNGAHKIQPITYWSEMEAYHLNNIFTMYAAGQLLWNPDRDPDEILREIAEGIWGPRNGLPVLEALKLIQDVRSGPSWNTFWWTTGDYRLGTAHPDLDVKRAEKVIAALEKMKTDRDFVSKFPLPFPPATFIELILPHLRQIRAFAVSRVKMDAIKGSAKEGASKSELTKMLHEAWQPVPEYNTWIGSFGQPEANMQEKMLEQLAKELNLELKMPGWILHRNADRYLQRIQNIQRKQRLPYTFNIDAVAVRGGEFTWTAEKSREYMDLLIRQGHVEKCGTNTYRLANWKEYRML